MSASGALQTSYSCSRALSLRRRQLWAEALRRDQCPGMPSHGGRAKAGRELGTSFERMTHQASFACSL